MISFQIIRKVNHKTYKCVFDRPHLNKIKYYKVSKIDYSKDDVVFMTVVYKSENYLFVCLFVLFHLLLTGAGNF